MGWGMEGERVFAQNLSVRLVCMGCWDLYTLNGLMEVVLTKDYIVEHTLVYNGL